MICLGKAGMVAYGLLSWGELRQEKGDFMKKYSWKSVGFNADVQKVGEELERINEITNKNVLEYAKDNIDSELHKCFEWNDEIASEKYRLIQATRLISSISFVIQEEPIKKQKVYYSIKTEEKEIHSFKNIKSILENENEYYALCNKAKKELENCKNNYNGLIKKDDLKKIIFEIYKEI